MNFVFELVFVLLLFIALVISEAIRNFRFRSRSGLSRFRLSFTDFREHLDFSQTEVVLLWTGLLSAVCYESISPFHRGLFLIFYLTLFGIFANLPSSRLVSRFLMLESATRGLVASSSIILLVYAFGWEPIGTPIVIRLAALLLIFCILSFWFIHEEHRFFDERNRAVFRAIFAVLFGLLMRHLVFVESWFVGCIVFFILAEFAWTSLRALVSRARVRKILTGAFGVTAALISLSVLFLKGLR